MKYRNRGAPFTRDDGSVWERGAVNEPTDNELRRRVYKLRPVLNVPVSQAAAVAPDAVAGEEVWPLQMRPEVYARLHPEGQHAELARKLLAVDEEDTGQQQEEEGAAPNGADE